VHEQQNAAGASGYGHVTVHKDFGRRSLHTPRKITRHDSSLRFTNAEMGLEELETEHLARFH
jgi:hypothetical protein